MNLKYEGIVFWHASGKEPAHLWVILNEPSAEIDAILVNFTKADNVISPPFVIPQGHLWYTPAVTTQFSTTLNVELARCVSLEVLTNKGLPARRAGMLNHRLLRKCRAAMYGYDKHDIRVQAVLDKFRQNWHEI